MSSIRNFFNKRPSIAARMRNAAGKHIDQLGNGENQLRIFGKNATDSSNAEFWLVGDIGENWYGEGITGKRVMEFFSDHRGKPVDVKIDTPGGDVYDGMNIMNTFLDHDARVVGTIVGLCYSAGSYAALGCDELRAHLGSNFGIHPAWTFAAGNQYQLRDSISWLETIDETLMQIYVARTGKSEEEMKDLFVGPAQDGTVMTAREAAAAGFVDEVIDIPAKDRKPSSDDESGDAEEASESETPDNKPQPERPHGSKTFPSHVVNVAARNRNRRQKEIDAKIKQLTQK